MKLKNLICHADFFHLNLSVVFNLSVSVRLVISLVSDCYVSIIKNTVISPKRRDYTFQ
jgi:hypothetical protein